MSLFDNLFPTVVTLNTNTSPLSQKAAVRPIGLVLYDFDSNSLIDLFVMPVRPEDLKWQSPSRMTTLQTLGGAWIDDFGPGIDSLTVTGTTGWHWTNMLGIPVGDGQIAMARLKSVVFTQWHAKRAAKVDNNRDPNTICLFWIDVLNGLAAIVAPQSFTLQRNKQRPLLLQYNMSLVVLDKVDAADAYSAAMGMLMPIVNAIIGTVIGAITGAVAFGLNASDSVSSVLSRQETLPLVWPPEEDTVRVPVYRSLVESATAMTTPTLTKRSGLLAGARVADLVGQFYGDDVDRLQRKAELTRFGASMRAMAAAIPLDSPRGDATTTEWVALDHLIALDPTAFNTADMDYAVIWSRTALPALRRNT